MFITCVQAPYWIASLETKSEYTRVTAGWWTALLYKAGASSDTEILNQYAEGNMSGTLFII